MAPGDGGQVNDNVAFFVPADDVLPVGDGKLIPVGQTQPGPDLRLLPEGQKALGAPQQNQQGQNRQHKPDAGAVQGSEGIPPQGQLPQIVEEGEKALQYRHILSSGGAAQAEIPAVYS